MTQTDTMLTFQLYGELGEKYGKEFELCCSSVREGLDILAANFKDFKQHLIDSDDWLAGYEVWAGETDLGLRDDDFLIRREGIVVKIIPVVKGASASARIIAGAVLVVIGVVVMYAFGWTGVGAAVGYQIASVGAALIVGGVAEKLLTKTATTPSYDTQVTDKATSYIFSGPTNNTRQGSAISVGYGRMIVGSNVISSAFTTVDVAV